MTPGDVQPEALVRQRDGTCGTVTRVTRTRYRGQLLRFWVLWDNQVADAEYRPGDEGHFERATWRELALLKDQMELEAILAEALGYPHDERYGWVTGDHTVVSLAMEARRKLRGTLCTTTRRSAGAATLRWSRT